MTKREAVAARHGLTTTLALGAAIGEHFGSIPLIHSDQSMCVWAVVLYRQHHIAVSDKH